MKFTDKFFHRDNADLPEFKSSLQSPGLLSEEQLAALIEKYKQQDFKKFYCSGNIWGTGVCTKEDLLRREEDHLRDFKSRMRWEGTWPSVYPPARGSCMPPTQSAAFTSVGLKPMPLPEKTELMGVTAYQVLKSERELLDTPEIPIYNDIDHALMRLRKSCPAPVGCQRVFHKSDLPYGVREHLRRYAWSEISQADVIVFPEPIVTDTAARPSLLATLRTRKWLVCLDRHTLDVLLEDPNTGQRDDLYTRRKENFLSLPCITARRLTKSGRAPKSPKDTVHATRRQWCLDHHCFSHPFFEAFTTPLSRLLSITRGHPSDCDNKVPGWKIGQQRSYHSGSVELINHYDRHPSISSFSFNEGKSSTWERCANTAASNAAAVAKLIDAILSARTDTPGELRVPLNYLRRRHLSTLTSLLALWHPFLHTLKSYPAPCSRLTSYQCSLNAKAFASLHHSLYTLSWKLGCRSYPTLPTEELKALFDGEPHVR